MLRFKGVVVLRTLPVVRHCDVHFYGRGDPSGVVRRGDHSRIGFWCVCVGGFVEVVGLCLRWLGVWEDRGGVLSELDERSRCRQVRLFDGGGRGESSAAPRAVAAFGGES